jgi:hypothetical protein
VIVAQVITYLLKNRGVIPSKVRYFSIHFNARTGFGTLQLYYPVSIRGFFTGFKQSETNYSSPFYEQEYLNMCLNVFYTSSWLGA